MCGCNPANRNPVCDSCPEELRRSWKMIPNPTGEEALKAALNEMRESVLKHNAAALQLAATVHKLAIEVRDLHQLTVHQMTKISDAEERIDALETALALGAKRGAA